MQPSTASRRTRPESCEHPASITPDPRSRPTHLSTVAPLITVRAAGPSDRDPIERFFAGLSDDTRRNRYHGVKRSLSSEELGRLTDPDRCADVTLVAETTAGEIIGLVEIIGPERGAEIAIVAADSWQGHGIGRRLSHSALTRHFSDHADAEVSVYLQPDNHRAIALYRGLGATRGTADDECWLIRSPAFDRARATPRQPRAADRARALRPRILARAW